MRWYVYKTSNNIKKPVERNIERSFYDIYSDGYTYASLFISVVVCSVGTSHAFLYILIAYNAHDGSVLVNPVSSCGF